MYLKWVREPTPGTDRVKASRVAHVAHQPAYSLATVVNGCKNGSWLVIDLEEEE